MSLILNYRFSTAASILEKTEELSFVAVDLESLNRELVDDERKKSFDLDQCSDKITTFRSGYSEVKSPIEERLIIITYDSETQTDQIEDSGSRNCVGLKLIVKQYRV